jgi:hypothetical protein
VTGRVWRGWAALCLVAGTVVVPLFWEVFSGGSLLRFLALPIRAFWIGGPVRLLLRERWVDPRVPAALVGGIVGAMALAVGLDLAGLRFVHPGWFLGMEWWQRPLYPWLALLPAFEAAGRPGYLWMVWAWTVVEGVCAVLWLTRAGSSPPARAT